MQSKAKTVQQYLAELPPDRRAALAAVREVILKNLDKHYAEAMSYGMIGYVVPHSVYPPGYHCDPKMPLPFAGLASQKNYMSLYMMSCYGEGPEIKWLREQFAKAGKKLDMGKCCIRFKKLEDLPLAVIGEAIRRVPAGTYIARYESAIQANRNRPAKGPQKKKSPARSNAKPTAPKPMKASARKPARKEPAAKNRP